MSYAISLHLLDGSQTATPSLIDALIRSGRAGLLLMQDDGSMPCGRNGPHQHRMTPVRNTGHWAILFAGLYRYTGEACWSRAARRCLEYLVCHGRPLGGAYWHRKENAKSSTNGLIGQAWTLEALLDGCDLLTETCYQAEAFSLATLHHFNHVYALWHEIDLAGCSQRMGLTLNQQIWFTAMAARAGAITEDTVKHFLDRLNYNSALRKRGVFCVPVLTGIRRKVHYWLHGASRYKMDVAYHVFTLLGLSFLYRMMPEHVYFSSIRFRKALHCAFSENFLQELERCRFGFPYNVPGLEMPYIWKSFQPMLSCHASRMVDRAWRFQWSQHFDENSGLLSRNTEDTETLSARIYEGVRLLVMFPEDAS